MTDTVTCDVLVIGSGAGGLAAAVTAGKLGLETIVAEKDAWFGGTTALSGGWLRIPCNPLAVRAGGTDSPDRVRTYLRHEAGGRAIYAESYDGLLLGDRLAQLRPQVREMTLFGLKVGSGPASIISSKRAARRDRRGMSQAASPRTCVAC